MRYFMKIMFGGDAQDFEVRAYATESDRCSAFEALGALGYWEVHSYRLYVA